MSIPLKEEEEKTNGGSTNILDVSVDEIEQSESKNNSKSEEVSFYIDKNHEDTWY